MMRRSSIQFAPSRRSQKAPACSRRAAYGAMKSGSRSAVAATFTSSARNVRITWKVILLLWLALTATLFLRGSEPVGDQTQVPVNSPMVRILVYGVTALDR